MNIKLRSSQLREPFYDEGEEDGEEGEVHEM